MIDKYINKIYRGLIKEDEENWELYNALKLIAAVGFDEGVKYEKRKHYTNGAQEVNKLDAEGKIIQTYPSIARATKDMELKSKNAIQDAIKRNIRCRGFYWEKVKK